MCFLRGHLINSFGCSKIIKGEKKTAVILAKTLHRVAALSKTTKPETRYRQYNIGYSIAQLHAANYYNKKNANNKKSNNNIVIGLFLSLTVAVVQY